jgi:hypothetical protein
MSYAETLGAAGSRALVLLLFDIHDYVKKILTYWWTNRYPCVR